MFVSAVRYRSSPGAGFVSEKIVWCIRSKTVRLWDPGFCLKPSISVYVRDRLGACSLCGTNFCWFGSRSRFSFLWNEILLCLRSETVRLRESVLVIYGPGPFSLRKHPFLLALRRWGRFARRTSATQRRKFHTDDANQCLHNKSGSHGVPNINLICLILRVFWSILVKCCVDLPTNSSKIQMLLQQKFIFHKN